MQPNFNLMTTMSVGILEQAVARAEASSGQPVGGPTIQLKLSDWEAVKSAAKMANATIGDMWVELQRLKK